MTIDQVIKLGEEITKPSLPWYSEFTLGFSLLILCMLVIGILLIWWGEINSGIMRQSLGSVTVIFSIILFIAGLVLSDSREDELYKLEVKKWENEIVKPFIESLSDEKREVIYIKIDPELSHKVEGQTWWGNGYTTSTAVERTPLTISFKDKGIVTRTNWFETHMELTTEEKPYIKYKFLPKDVGHGIKKGVYNSKVFLPENYTFTDIK